MSEPNTPDPAPRPRAPVPWWVPEARVWIAAAVFGFAWHILNLLADSALAAKTELSKDTLFVSIASGIFGGSGVLAVIGFYYMASKKDGGARGGQ